MRGTIVGGLKVTAATLAAGAFIAAAPSSEGDYLMHTVGRGETVSLICIRYYGHYTTELAASIKRANPSLTDINMIKPGQKIRLRRPLKAREPAAVVHGEETSLYEYRLQATQGVVTLVEGSAKLKRPGRVPVALAANTILEPGDTVQTGPTGRVEIIINREAVVRLNADSRAVLLALRDSRKDASKTTVGLSLGTLWTRVRSARDRLCRFELELPTAVAGVHGTVYQTTVATDRSTEVKVYEGEVSVNGTCPPGSGATPAPDEVPGPEEVPGPHEVSMEEWVRIVRAMQRMSVDNAGRPSQPSEFKRNPNDAWERFNEERDRQISTFVTEL